MKGRMLKKAAAIALAATMGLSLVPASYVGPRSVMAQEQNSYVNFDEFAHDKDFIDGGTNAKVSYQGQKISVTASDWGNDWGGDSIWQIQLKELFAKEAAKYKVSFKAKATSESVIGLKVGLLTSDAATYHYNPTIVLPANEEISYSAVTNMTAADPMLLFALGNQPNNVEKTIEIYDVVFTPVTDEVETPGDASDVEKEYFNFEEINHSDFFEGTNVAVDYKGEKIIATGSDWGGDWGGDSHWQIQLKEVVNIAETGDYTLSFDVKPTKDATFAVKVGDLSNDSVENVFERGIVAKGGEINHYEIKLKNSIDILNPMILFALGSQYDTNVEKTIEIYNVALTKEKSSEQAPSTPEVSGRDHDFTATEGDVADPGLTKEGFKLVWADEFDGNYADARVDANTGLNLDNWAYQLGDGTTDCGNYGWGNQELQCYTANEKNIAVNEDLTGDGNKDGLLRITASYEPNGYTYANESKKNYTSARIRTTDREKALFSTTYGYIESRIALPLTKGAWPAFWMLPQSTEIYGGWPVSGEIDILETVGVNNNQACGTLHWGVPQHVYKGSGYVDMPSGYDNTYFHTYAINWEPGQIQWIYDGKVINTMTNWASTLNGANDELGFDAPFDQPFYTLLNLAVDSGNFGGAANKATFTGDMNMYVDYVRVFQKEEGYPAEVVKTANNDAKVDWTELVGINQIAEIKEDNLDAVGGGHNDTAAAGQDKWYLSTQDDATATAQTVKDANGKVWDKVNIQKAGSQDYSVQLIGHYDAKKGYVYKVSFDAYGEGAIVGQQVNCDSKEYAGWSTYGIKGFEVSDKPESYSYLIEQVEDFDNCRIEFNVGARGTGTVYVSNVKVEVVDPAILGVEQSGGPHGAMADGQMIYNGKFDQGNYHLGNWSASEGTKVSVPRYTLEALTDRDVKVVDSASGETRYYERRAQISAADGIAPQIYQSNIKMTADKYTVAFDMYSQTDSAVKVSLYSTKEEGENIVLDKEITKATASYKAVDGVKKYVLKLNLDEEISNAAVVFTFAKNTKVQLDNVKMTGVNQDTGVETNPVNENTTWAGDDGYGNGYGINVTDGLITMAGIKSGAMWYGPQLGSSDFALVAGAKYKLHFDFKTIGGNNTIEYIVQVNGGSWAVVKDVTKVAYDESKATDGFMSYDTEFISPISDKNVHLNFGFGNSGADGNMSFLLKNVSLELVKSDNEDSTNGDNETIDETVFDNGANTPVVPEEPAHTHTPANAVRENIVEPTCAKEGHHDEVVYCEDENCKEEISRTTVRDEKTNNHELNPVNKQSSTLKAGYEAKVCSVCHEEFDRVEIPRIGSIILDEYHFVADNKEHKPTAIVNDVYGTILVEGRDYTVTYSGNGKNKGAYTATIKFQGKYTGTDVKVYYVESPVVNVVMKAIVPVVEKVTSTIRSILGSIFGR